jgi:hypothetical protein
MASKTKRTEIKRTKRDKAQARKRKNGLANNGSTKSQKELFQD